MEENRGLLKIINSEEYNEIISEDDKSIIEVKLWSFLGKRIERYTMGDSTSVPMEIAEELFKSLCFSLELLLRNKKNKIMLLKNENLDTLLKEAWVIIEDKIAEGKELLDKVNKASTNIENISYKDTINEIREFFKRYNYRFFAQNIECSIDYQLSIPVSEQLQGIEYINKYLTHLLIENEFCRLFNNDKIIYLLNRYCSDYKGLLINIFEPVLTNAIGLILINRDVLGLDISNNERKLIMDKLVNKSKDEISEYLKNAANKLCDTLEINEAVNRFYIEKVTVDLYSRIQVGLESRNLENIFLSFKYDELKEEIIFKDNINMSNETLRNLINEINDCRYISDKIQMVKDEVKSISDLIEILNECFFDNEVLELLKTYSKEELFVINHYLEGEGDLFTSNSKWEVIFKKYFMNTVINKIDVNNI